MKYQDLIGQINADINTNGNRAITGAKMNSVLNEMVSVLGDGFRISGEITPQSEAPTDPENGMCYIAATSGSYVNFGNIGVNDDEIAFIYYDSDNESWNKMRWSRKDFGLVVVDVSTLSSFGEDEMNEVMKSVCFIVRNDAEGVVDRLFVKDRSANGFVWFYAAPMLIPDSAGDIVLEQGCIQIRNTAEGGRYPYETVSISYKLPTKGNVTHDLSLKADKVSDATQGNLAALDSSGNLTDSGISSNNIVQKSQTSGLLKNDGTVDTTQYGTYSKPSGGIPKTDLATAVQTSLGLADTAVQTVQVGTTTTGIAGTDASVTNSGTATAPVLNFTIPRGANGQDAVNPFKGWWPDLATLKAAITAQPGNSAYVKDASPATTWSIYVYDATASSNKYWADSGTDADTSTLQTFATGEEVNEVHIVNDLNTGGVHDVLSAEQGKALNDKFKEQFGESTNVVSSTYFTNRVYKKNGSYIDSGSATPYLYTVVFPILTPSYNYSVSFRSIGSGNIYSDAVSILMLDDNDNVTGWLFDQAWSEGVAKEYFDYNIGQLPSGTTKIYVYVGPNQSVASVKCEGANTINLPSALSGIDERITKLQNSIHYSVETPINTYTGKSLLNNGELSSLSTYTTYEYQLRDGVKYTVDLNIATSSYPNNVGLCYFDENMQFISFDCPARTNSNEERNLLFNYQLNVPANSKYVRVARSTSAQSTYDMQLRSYANAKLFGKKIAVIGDSISTHGVFTTPYKRVTESDVGVAIQSYVTYYDSHNQAGGSITKTIGGVTLTNAMNDGELHSFTPTSADVGKSIGVPKYYTNNDSILTWVDIMARCLGARVIANASFCGSSITTSSEARGSQYVNCASWKDYTLARCRDNFFGSSSFDLESPDIIIVYRGTNDFSYTNNGAWAAQTLDEPNLMNGLDYSNYTNDIKDNSYQFKEAYYVLINRLREMYPTAIIALATLNVFKRVNYSSWPTRNDVYTLPDYNNAIRDVANNMGCLLIELDKDGITFQNCYSEGYITDNATTPTHPNQKGHWVMGVKAASDIDYALCSTTFEL